MNQTSITESVVPSLGDFSSRLVSLCDGRQGLRESLHTSALPAGDSTLDFVSSDETLDRWGEVISAAGWRLENYRRNPVFQNAHQYGDVIFTLGRALVTEVREIEGRAALYQRIEFAVEANPMARIAYGLYRGGFLRAVSVGFIPLRWADVQGEKGTGLHRRHLEQELLEVSAVSIPANPNALALGVRTGAIAKGDLAEALDLVRALLDQPAPGLQPNGFEEHFLLARELREVLRRDHTRPRSEQPARQRLETKGTDMNEIINAPGAATAAAPGEEQQLHHFRELLGEIKGGWAEVKRLPVTFKSFQEEHGRLQQHVNEVRRVVAARSGLPSRERRFGQVSDECAREVAAVFIAHCEKSGKLEALASLAPQRDGMSRFAREILTVSTRTALGTAEIPLPEQYGGELRELISDFGVARRHMSPYPIGMGTAKPARMGVRPAFGSVAMSSPFTEKSPTFSFASLESHKLGGIVRVPRELDEQSVVAMGRFLTRYGAVEFARAEDQWAFLADGSATYESVKGVVAIARDGHRTQVLAAGKTKPSDATLDDFRALRSKVNKAALNGRLSAYYLDSTWEGRLPSFRTDAEPNVYQRLPDGTAILDGYPVVWTDVLTPYGVAAQADSALAVFGALSFWWMGEHGHPRIDTSEHVWFSNDQLAVRFIEEIDFDYIAADATAALLTPEE